MILESLFNLNLGTLNGYEQLYQYYMLIWLGDCSPQEPQGSS